MFINNNPKQIKSKRLALGLTQTKAADVIYSKLRTWQDWESGRNTMHPALWELFLIKTKRNSKMESSDLNKIQIASDFVSCHKVFDNAEAAQDLLSIYNKLIGGVYGEVRQESDGFEFFLVVEISGRETATGNPFLFEFDILNKEH